MGRHGVHDCWRMYSPLYTWLRNPQDEARRLNAALTAFPKESPPGGCACMFAFGILAGAWAGVGVWVGLGTHLRLPAWWALQSCGRLQLHALGGS